MDFYLHGGHGQLQRLRNFFIWHFFLHAHQQRGSVNFRELAQGVHHGAQFSFLLSARGQAHAWIGNGIFQLSQPVVAAEMVARGPAQANLTGCGPLWR